MITHTDPKMGESESVILTEEAKTIAEAIRIIKAKIDKELDFGHAKLIVIGEGFAKDGISGMLDWFSRRRDLQQVAYVGLGKPDAISILENKPKVEQIPGNYLFISFGDTGTETPLITTTYFYHFRSAILEKGLDAVLPKGFSK